jgi:hypothetical protein
VRVLLRHVQHAQSAQTSSTQQTNLIAQPQLRQLN